MGKNSLLDRLKQKREDLKKGSGGYAYYTIKEGKLRVRHLPVGDEKDWSIEATCFWLGPNLGLLVSPVTIGKRCALMEAYEKLSNSKDQDNRELAKKLKPKKKLFSPVVPYKDTKGKELDWDQGPKLLIMGPQLCGQLVDLFLDEEDGGDFTNLEDGYDIKYNRTGKGINDTEYTLIKGETKAIKLPKEFRGKTWDPEEMLKEIIPTFKETKEKLEKFLNLPDDEEPKKRKGKKDRKNKDL